MLDGDSDDDDDDDFEQKSKSSHSEGGQQLPDFDNLPDEKLPIPYELPTKLKIVRNEDYEAEQRLAEIDNGKLALVEEEDEYSDDEEDDDDDVEDKFSQDSESSLMRFGLTSGIKANL